MGLSQVMPWAHYRDEAARLLRVDTHTSAASERELMRVRNAIVQVGKVVRLSCFVSKGTDLLCMPPLLGFFCVIIKTLVCQLLEDSLAINSVKLAHPPPGH